MTLSNSLDRRLDQIRRLIRDLDAQCAEMRHAMALSGPAGAFFTPQRLGTMDRIARRALLPAALMIHGRQQGHLASTASALHIMAAIYFSRAWDWVRAAESGDRGVLPQFESHKPHAVPGWYGLLYLEGRLSRRQMQAFRTFGGPNAYPTHEDPGIDIPTGSLGLGPAAAMGLAFLDAYNADHGVTQRRGLQISIIGDSEFDEGIILESIKERASRGIRGWIEFIDYNRQSLDGNLDERLVDRIAALYEAHGIPVVLLKYGSMLQALFAQDRGGAELKERLDALSTEDYQALLRRDGGVIRRVLTLRRHDFERFRHEGVRRIDDFLARSAERSGALDPQLAALLHDRSDGDVKAIFSNLGGHDLPMLISVIERVKAEGAAAAVIAYTIKGWSVEPLLGSLSGHWARLTPQDVDHLGAWLGADLGDARDPWQRFDADDAAGALLLDIGRARRHHEAAMQSAAASARAALRHDLGGGAAGEPVPARLPEPDAADAHAPIATQTYLGLLLGRLARVKPPDPLAHLADRVVTMAADVAFTAGLKDWVNERGVWGPPPAVDVRRKYGEAPEMDVQPRPDGQHIRLSNLEQFLGMLAAAFGKSADLTAQRRFPFAFFYDVFLERFAEMFKYAAYWDAAVWFVGTICGASAPGESGLHHGATSGLIGRVTPNAITWEPTFAREVNWIVAEEFRRAVCDADAGRRVRYLRVTAAPVSQQIMDRCLRAQPRFREAADEAIERALRPEVLAGGYRLVDGRASADYRPGGNVVNLFATGVSVIEAVKAAAALRSGGLCASVIAVTSPDLLIDGADHGHLMHLVPEDERAARVPIVSVTDSHPLYLEGLGRRLAAGGPQPPQAALGVHRFDRSGTQPEILHYHGIDADAIVEAARSVCA